jgi:hypothetical protein
MLSNVVDRAALLSRDRNHQGKGVDWKIARGPFLDGLRVGDDWYHIDLSWQQFPAGSIVREFAVLERQELNDSEATRLRCALLLKRVDDYLQA